MREVRDFDDRALASSVILGAASFELLMWLATLPIALTSPWQSIPRAGAAILISFPLPILMAIFMTIKANRLVFAACILLLPMIFVAATAVADLIGGSRLLALLRVI